MATKIKTYCRFHLLDPKSNTKPAYEIFQNNILAIENTKISYTDYSLESTKTKYKFDRIFNESTQNDIFIEIIKPIIRDVFLSSSYKIS